MPELWDLFDRHLNEQTLGVVRSSSSIRGMRSNTSVSRNWPFAMSPMAKKAKDSK